jgi:hypothetical protein
MGEIGGKPADAVAVPYCRYQPALLSELSCLTRQDIGGFRHASGP